MLRLNASQSLRLFLGGNFVCCTVLVEHASKASISVGAQHVAPSLLRLWRHTSTTRFFNAGVLLLNTSGRQHLRHATFAGALAHARSKVSSSQRWSWCVWLQQLLLGGKLLCCNLFLCSSLIGYTLCLSGIKCSLGLNTLTRHGCIGCAAHGTQRTTHQDGLVCSFAVLFDRLWRRNIKASLRTLKHALGHFNRHLNGSALNGTTASSLQQRPLSSSLHGLLCFGGHQSSIIGDAEHAFDDTLTKRKCSTSTLKSSLTCCGGASSSSVNTDVLTLSNLFGGLTLHVGAKELRQQCCTGANNTATDCSSRTKSRAGHGAKLCATSHCSELRNLTGQSARHLTDCLASSGQQTLVFVCLLYRVKRYALASGFTDLLATTNTGTSSLFWRAEQRLRASLNRGCKLLTTANNLTADGGLASSLLWPFIELIKKVARLGCLIKLVEEICHSLLLLQVLSGGTLAVLLVELCSKLWVFPKRLNSSRRCAAGG